MRNNKLAEIINSKRDNLVESLNKIKFYVDINANQKQCRKEPDIVLDLIQTIIRFINEYLYLELYTNDFIIKSGGVFVHASPCVSPTNASFPCTTPASVEIGDLLLMIKHITCRQNKITQISQKALLIQAKMSSKIDNINQLFLYTKWPEFEYVRPANFALGNRNLRINNIDVGTKYLILDQNLSNSVVCNFDDHQNQKQKNIDNFVDLLLNFFQGKAGLNYKTQNDWHKVVQELWECTKDKTFKSLKRGCDTIGFICGDFDNYLRLTGCDTKSFVIDNRNNDNENIGVATIRISITDHKD